MNDELFGTLLQRIRDQETQSAARESVPSITYRRRIANLDVLRHLLERLFRTPEARERWLNAPSSSLGGPSPLTVLAEDDVDAVLKLVIALSAGTSR